MKRNIIIAILALLLLIGVSGTFWGSSIAMAASGIWNSCPRGEVNDTYPGDCHDYIDTNKDRICDRSQSNPQSGQTSQTPSVTISTDSAAKNSLSGSTTNAAAGGDIATGNRNSYNLIPICLFFIVLYSITWLLTARKIIKKSMHRKIWNIVLLISLVGSVFLGLVRILSIDFNIDIALPFNVIFWHVETSIVLGAVVLVHILWHWRYFIAKMGKSDKYSNSTG